MTTVYKQLSELRKQEQTQGVTPEWVNTAGFQMFKERYLYEADNFKEQIERIAKTAASHLPEKHQKAAEKRFYELLWNGHLSASTPVLANMGTNRGLPVSCSGSDVQDTIDGMYSSALEAANLTRYGFGTSSYLGNIRPRGSAISTGGKASGVVPVFAHFVSIMRDVSQAGIRRGSWAGYLPIEHGDFDELSDYVKDNPDDANVGWNISDAFIEKLKSKDPDATRRYKKAMKLKMLTGKGYFYLIDSVNRQNPKMYKDLGLSVKASNLCVGENTNVKIRINSEVSKTVTIKELTEMFEPGKYEIWSFNLETNTGEWQLVENAGKTRPNAKVLKITDEKIGKSITCTPDHKIWCVNKSKYIEAQHLTESDVALIS